MNPFPNNELKGWIAEGYLKQAIRQLLAVIQRSEDFPAPSFKAQFVQEVSLLSSRYSEMEKKAGLGQVSPDDYLLEHNRVAHACLQLIDRAAEVSNLSMGALPTQFEQLKKVKASDLGNRNFIQGNDNIVIQDAAHAHININVNKGGGGFRFPKILIALLVVVFLSGTSYYLMGSHKSETQFKQLLVNGGFYEFNAFKAKSGQRQAHIDIVNDSLRNNPAVKICGTWGEEVSTGFVQVRFYRENCQLYLEYENEIYPCKVTGSNSDNWRLQFEGDMEPAVWRIRSLTENYLQLKIGSEAVLYKRMS